MRDGDLKGIQAVVERQQRVPTKSDDDCLAVQGQDGGFDLFWPGWQIIDEASLNSVRPRGGIQLIETV